VVLFIQLIKAKVEAEFAEMSEKPELLFEVGVIAYRDFSDRCQFETLDFTQDLGMVSRFIEKLVAAGGGDIPEDVQGAFIHCLLGIDNENHCVSWRSKAEGASRSIVWATDSPPHGECMTASGTTDSYPASCSISEWKKILNLLSSHSIGLTIVPLTKGLTKCCEWFQNKSIECSFDLTVSDFKSNVVQKTGGEKTLGGTALASAKDSVSFPIPSFVSSLFLFSKGHRGSRHWYKGLHGLCRKKQTE
jgi:hypothetical protein